MHFENKLLCHHSFVHLITEDDLAERDCVSLVGHGSKELNIFLGKADNKKCYEVCIRKLSCNEIFVPNKSDVRWSMFVSNDNSTNFFFIHFINALSFVTNLRKLHPEYEAHYAIVES